MHAFKHLNIIRTKQGRRTWKIIVLLYCSVASLEQVRSAGKSISPTAHYQQQWKMPRLRDAFSGWLARARPPSHETSAPLSLSVLCANSARPSDPTLIVLLPRHASRGAARLSLVQWCSAASLSSSVACRDCSDADDEPLGAGMWRGGCASASLWPRKQHKPTRAGCNLPVRAERGVAWVAWARERLEEWQEQDGHVDGLPDSCLPALGIRILPVDGSEDSRCCDGVTYLGLLFHGGNLSSARQPAPFFYSRERDGLDGRASSLLGPTSLHFFFVFSSSHR